MARIQGIIGTGSGRLGQAVLSKGDNGQTVARTYQDQVRNPRTIEQRKQRAKMNLAGQLSKITPASALIGLGNSNGRGVRAAFVRNILNACTVTDNGNGEYVAQLNLSNLSFATGNVQLASGMLQYYLSGVSEALDGIHMQTAFEFLRYSVGISGVSFRFKWSGTSELPYVTLNDILSAVTPKGVYGELYTIIMLQDGYYKAVIPSAKLIYGTTFDPSYSCLYNGYNEFSVIAPLNINLKPNQSIHIFRTPFVINENASAILGKDAGISGEDIVASCVTRKSLSDILTTYGTFNNIPSSVVCRLIEGGGAKWGKSSYLGQFTNE